MKTELQKIKHTIKSGKPRIIVKGLIVSLMLMLQILTIFSFNQQTYADTLQTNSNKGLNFELNRSVLLVKPDEQQIALAMQQKAVKETEERIERERQDKINGLVSFLKKQGSPVATTTYAAQIIDLAAANGADYKIVVAIMGVESGFCRAPVRIDGNSHNCFGYLNGVRYDSFTDAFNAIVPKVSRQYANRYGWDFESLAKAYGQIGWEKTSHDMRDYANSL